MPLFRKAIPGLYDGVSQQDATMRTALQAEVMENGWATIADGLQKRPPTEQVAQVSPTPFGAATIHHINRDITERYVVVVTDGDLKVFDHDTGVEQTVTFPEGKSYLSVSDAKEDFALVTVADYTFVVNRDETIAMEVTPQPSYSNNIWLNRYVDGNEFPGNNFQYVYADTAGEVFRGEVQRFADLPDTPANGDIYKITGSDENGFSAFYVKRVGAVWEEYRQPGLQNRLDSSTMPHALVRQADGTFNFAPFSWDERKVGDQDSNPVPTFVGRKLQDVFFVQNRLGFLVDENSILSCSGDYGNFWRNTVTTLVSSDVIDVAVTGAQVSLLKHAIPFNDTVMLFSDQNQFVLSWGTEGLDHDSVAMTPVTSYRMNVIAKPVTIGRDTYFASESSGFTKVYEYYNRPSGEGSLNQAADITGHVPRYLPSGITQLTPATSEETLFAIAADVPGEERTVYVYKFTWQSADQKAQSSWSKWFLPEGCKVLSLTNLDDFLYVLAEYADGVFLERVNLRSLAAAPGFDDPIYLDRRVLLTGIHDFSSDRTVYTLPYDFPTEDIRVIQGAAGATPQSLFDPSQYTFPDVRQVAVPGNHAGIQMILGTSYTFKYTFSAQFATTDSGAILTGRTILRSMTLRFNDSGFFTTQVKPYGEGETFTEDIVPSKLAFFSGKTLGESSLVLGQATYDTGEYTFQVYGEAETAEVTIINDSHVSSTFTSAEAELTYYNRAR